MKSGYMQEKPQSLPTTQPNGKKLKSIIDVALCRRATAHFAGPRLDKPSMRLPMLAAQAPSGYNLQPGAKLW